MPSRSSDIDDQSTADSTPEDVAALYSWANLQGAKYRDYSASRREYRAQVRYRAAKALLERELRTQAEDEAAAARAERAAAAADSMGATAEGNSGEALGAWSAGKSEEAARQAAAERVEAARRAEAAACAAVAALREEREVAEAHTSARRQAQIYEESELRRRQLAGPQPHSPFGSGQVAPEAGAGDLRSDETGNQQQSLFSGWQGLSTQSTAADLAGRASPGPVDSGQDAPDGGVGGPAGDEAQFDEFEQDQGAPAWLFSAQSPPRPTVQQAISQNFKGETAGGDTLQDSRERVAARWFALKGVFERGRPELPAMHAIRPGDAQKPLLAVFSIAGGAGKTSLVATLGRALSAQGENVVLADTTSHGLLPIYFGCDDVRAGVVQAIPPAAGSSDPPVSLAAHDFAGRDEDERQREALTDDVLRSGLGSHRLLLDICSGTSWLIRRLVGFHPIVLVPMAPDMNSVIGLRAAERLFRGMVDSEGRSLMPFYVLNQFDASLPLHLDVREVFRRQLGDRLLRTAIRRSPKVSEALAAGMTVLDYAGEAPVSQDYRDVAAWLRSVSPPATEEFRRLRWGRL